MNAAHEKYIMSDRVWEENRSENQRKSDTCAACQTHYQEEKNRQYKKQTFLSPDTQNIASVCEQTGR